MNTNDLPGYKVFEDYLEDKGIKERAMEVLLKW